MISQTAKANLRGWLNTYDFNIAVTLKLHRRLCPIKANSLFEAFSARQDRKLFGRYFYRKLLGVNRSFAIGFIENGYSGENTHIHLAVAVPKGKEQQYIDNAVSSLFSVWRSGTVEAEQIYNKVGWINYISKFTQKNLEMVIAKGKIKTVYSEVS